MKIALKCKCGSEAEFEDPRGSYINLGGISDSKGRVYRVGAFSAEWLERHADCARWIAPKAVSEGEGKK